MATKEDQETLRRFVQHVTRAFYEPKYTVVLDQLSRHPVLKEDDLAGRMGLQSKELNKLMAVLSNDRLVQVYRQNELKEGAQRSVGKAYYYIDYQHFCNVVKWRMSEMRRIIDKEQRNELDTQGYLCPQCGKQFATTEADKLVDFMTGLFHCDVCRAEVVNNEDSASAKAGQDRMQRFNRQTQHIRDGLKASEEMVMPAFDVAAYVKEHLVGTEADREQRLANGEGGGADAGRKGGELKIAGMNGNKREDAGVGVVMSLDVDEETARTERARAAEAKKAQNALPSWHLQSTISGHLTALGIAERARRQAAVEAEGRVEKAGDESLKGLGTVGTVGIKSEPGSSSLVTLQEDVKPSVDPTTDYYDAYYATLAASASHSTPTSASLADDLVEEEEDVKPNLEYLNSLNDYRKRTRSEELNGDEPARKLAKTEEEPVAEAEKDGTTGEGTNDDPIVYVDGKPIAFSLITEEHQELMSPEEYQAYFDVYSARA